MSVVDDWLWQLYTTLKCLHLESGTWICYGGYLSALWKLKWEKDSKFRNILKNFTDEEGRWGDSHSCSEGVMETEYVCVGEAQDELIMNKLVQGMYVSLG